MKTWHALHNKSRKRPIEVKPTSSSHIHREILSLFQENLSPNQIARHLRQVELGDIKPYKVKRILLEHQEVLAQVNNIFDNIASQQISIMEMDETFKGRRYIVLVVMDSITGYVFLIQKIKKRNMATLKEVLWPLRDLLRDTRLVLTDGAPYFPQLIKEFCPNAAHQICLVHVMRNLRKELIALREHYGKALQVQKTLTLKLNAVKEMNLHFQKQRKNTHQKLRYHLQKRSQLRRHISCGSLSERGVERVP